MIGPVPTARRRAVGALVLAALVSLPLAACGDDSTTATTATPTTAPAAPASSVAADATTEADAPVPTSAPPEPAKVTGGAATIDVKVGTDDFETSKGTRVVSVPKGTQLTINLTAAEGESYHLHGYDMEEEDIAPGKTATFSFTADQTGRFDLESHITEKTLLVLVVE